MHQILYEFSVFGHKVPIYGYGIMIVAALYASTALAAWRARREKLDPETIYDLSFWVVIGGLLVRWVFYVWQYWGTKIKTIGEAFRFWQGGIVFYGCILGGFAAIYLYWRIRRFPFQRDAGHDRSRLGRGNRLGSHRLLLERLLLRRRLRKTGVFGRSVSGVLARLARTYGRRPHSRPLRPGATREV